MIQTEKLCKTYDGFSAVDEVTLRVAPKRNLWVFWGRTVREKTTTILMLLLGIEKPTSGQIYLFDQPLHENYFEIKTSHRGRGRTSIFFTTI